VNSLCISVIPDIVYVRKLINEINTKVYLANIKADEAHSLGTLGRGEGLQTESILKDVEESHRR
jgi:2C-methyl-D-erythritol 2,4-cyclodiphosphate synthase